MKSRLLWLKIRYNKITEYLFHPCSWRTHYFVLIAKVNTSVSHMLIIFLTKSSFWSIVMFLKIFILGNTESKFTVLEHLRDKLLASVFSAEMPLYSHLLKEELYAFLPSWDSLIHSQHESLVFFLFFSV